MKHIKIKPAAVGVYLIGFIILYLPAMTMAGVLLYLFCLYAAFPLVSLAFFLIAYFRFRYFEEFSTEHPVKGQEVSYKLSLASEANVPGPFVSVKFKMISPDQSVQLNDIHTSLASGEVFTHEYKIRYPYRGIYKVGIDYIELQEVLSWISLLPPVWFRTFYVYPRIIELDAVFPNLQNVVEASGYGQGILDDYTLFKNLQDYRPGDSIKHIAWKKFATTGEPVVKLYEKTSWPGVEIYLDLRREREPDHKVLEREDCSVEILVALVKYFLKNQIPVTVHAVNGGNNYYFSGSDNSYFDDFYKSTINLNFAGDYSPAKVFLADMQDKLINSSTVIFITHRFDSEILDLVYHSMGSEVSIFTIINQSDMDTAEKQKEILISDSFSHVHGRVIFVNSMHTIKQDIEA